MSHDKTEQPVMPEPVPAAALRRQFTLLTPDRWKSVTITSAPEHLHLVQEGIDLSRFVLQITLVLDVRMVWISTGEAPPSDLVIIW